MHLGQSQARESKKGSNQRAEQGEDKFEGQFRYGTPEEREEDTARIVKVLCRSRLHSFNLNKRRRGLKFSAHTENPGLGVRGTAEHCWRSWRNLENING